MPAGKLSVSPLTINGLAQNGFPTSQTFVGCYVSPSEKQRTNSVSGPEPHYQDTLTCKVGENDQSLFIDVINEDPARPGPIGSAQISLYKVFESRKFEDWVPLTTNANTLLGHIFMKLSFEPSSSQEHQYENPYGMPPPTPSGFPPSYNEAGHAEQRKVETPYTSNHEPPMRHDSTSSLGPESPMPAQYGMGQAPYFPPQQPVHYNSQSSMPGSENHSTPAYNPPLAVTPGATGTSSPTVPPKKKGVPDWMKYGGAALAGAAAVGLGTWVASEIGDDEEEEEEERRKAAYEQQQRAMEDGAYGSQNFQDAPPEHYSQREYDHEAYEESREREDELREEAREREDELREEAREREDELREEAREREEELLEEQEELREEQEEREEEWREEQEEREEELREEQEEREEELREEQEEREEELREEQEEREEELREEQEEREEEEAERPIINDSKWR